VNTKEATRKLWEEWFTCGRRVLYRVTIREWGLSEDVIQELENDLVIRKATRIWLLSKPRLDPDTLLILAQAEKEHAARQARSRDRYVKLVGRIVERSLQ